MGLFSDIISAVGNGFNDIFGGGNSAASNNNNQKKKVVTPTTPSSPSLQVRLPQPLSNLQATHTPAPPVNIAPVDNSGNLTAAPVHALAPTPVAPHIASTPTPIVNSDNITNIGNLTPGHISNGTPYTQQNQPGYFKAMDLGGDIAANVGSGLLQGTAKLIGSPLSLASLVSRDVFNDPNAANAIDKINMPSRIGNDIGVSRKQVDQSAQQEGISTPYKIGSVIGSTALMVPGLATAATKLPVVGDSIANGLSKLPAVGRLFSSGAEASSAGETAGLNADESPTAPESGTKPIEEKPSNAPTSETAAPTTAPNAPESGVKPVTPTPTPTVTPPTIAPKPTEITPITPTTPTAPIEGTPAPAPVQTAQDAAQQVVNKAAETPPTAPAPSTSAPLVTPAEQASQAAVPEQAVAAQAGADNAVAPIQKETGNVTQDLQNALEGAHARIANESGYSNSKNAQDLVDTLTGRNQAANTMGDIIRNRMENALTPEQQDAIVHALQTNTVDKLPADEQAVAKLLQQHIENPSDVFRSSQDSEYSSADNHTPQVRKGGGLKTAVQSAKNAGGNLRTKITNFSDLLSQPKSRFSQSSTMGNFTDKAGNTITGDAPDLGLVAKKDGTFVDKNGKVYNYSRATSQDLKGAGVKLQDASSGYGNYVSDTLRLREATNARSELLSNPEKYGLSKAETPNSVPVDFKDATGTNHTFYTDEKTAQSLRESGVANGGAGAHPIAQLWNKATSGLVQTIVANPVVHSSNQLVQALMASGLRGNGIGGLSFLKQGMRIDPEDLLHFQENGGYVPSYGKNLEGPLSKLTFGVSKLNEKAMSAIDGNFRVKAFNSLTNGGMDPKEAAQMVNKFMGDSHTFDNASPHMMMFWHYFETMNKSAASAIGQTFKGHPGALLNGAMALAASYGLQKAWQEFTGNPDASIHMPGAVGLVKNYAGAIENLAKGNVVQAFSPVTNRINPLATTGAEQVLGVNNYGDKFNTTTNTRANNLLGADPVTNLFNNNGHSIGEKAANTFGLYTSHIKGDMAASPTSPLAPILNVNGAQNGSTVAFPKDFTGEQSNKAYNNYLNTTGSHYTSQGNAQFNAVPQTEQQAIQKAGVSLKAVGVTNVGQVRDVSQLSPSDQQSYVNAVKQLNTAGSSTKTTDVEKQLVANGNTALAASLNKTIPQNLSQQDKNALETYSTLSSAGQKNVWLQNNDNAVNYYNAVINQKQAQGALTTADQNTNIAWSGSGNSLYVKTLAAQVDQKNNVSQSTIELYKDTTKSAYDKMTGAQKDALTQYAQQLNAGGVIDKFGIATGTTTSSTATTSSSKLFHDLGLPSSGNALLMPKATTGLTSSTVAYKAPTLKTASVSTAKHGNPFARSITATKGVR